MLWCETVIVVAVLSGPSDRSSKASSNHDHGSDLFRGNVLPKISRQLNHLLNWREVVVPANAVATMPQAMSI